MIDIRYLDIVENNWSEFLFSFKLKELVFFRVTAEEGGSCLL